MKVEHPLAVVVDEVGPQHLRHGLVVEENAFDDHREAHGGQHFADEDDEAEDGRDPAGIERHDPVDRGEGDGEAVEDQPGSSDGLEALGVVGGAGAVGLLGPLRQQEREQIPDGEIENCAIDEAVRGEVGFGDVFEVLAQVLVGDVFERLRPDVDPCCNTATMIGMNRTASRGTVRMAAPRMRRMTMPQPPPVRCRIMRMAMEPRATPSQAMKPSR